MNILSCYKKHEYRHILDITFLLYGDKSLILGMSGWTFFTNHGHILFIIALNPSMPVRQIANNVGITERSALKIISDLVSDEYIFIQKVGRNNVYTVNLDKHLRHSIEKECTVGEVIETIKLSKSKDLTFDKSEE